ncbi:hypothetical protein [Faecalibaculum rodentium]|uniref:hypothetical protein n=1 Tax=Faecalibaculum rodentium TaxID=1702221 RepID=UPI002493DFB8|nr:hypothetical protein [Faecalibaculum rodentium]
MAEPNKASNNRQRKVKTPRQPRQKQGHLLVWITLVIIAIPCVIVGYVLLTSMEEQNEPVVGVRFDSNDLNPKIEQSQLDQIRQELSGIGGVESVTDNLKSATLRIHLNMADDADRGTVEAAMTQARDIVNSILPFDTYFTNTENGKNYDIEIDSYNWIVDDSHPQDGQIYFKLTKTGAGNEVVDVISEPKDPDLVSEIVRQ